MALTDAVRSSPQISNGSRSASRVPRDPRSNFDSKAYPGLQNTFVDVYISHLPPGTSTLEIHDNLKQYGNVSWIKISDRREDDRGTSADVRFEPPPQIPIWQQQRIFFQFKGGRTTIQVRLSNRTGRKFTIPSPIRPGVDINKKTELFLGVIQFGIMQDPHTMLHMASRKNPENPPRMVLELRENDRQNEIHVFFPSQMASDTRIAWRDFRFSIALDDNFTIWELPGNEYIIQLPKVPWYSKQLKEIVAVTHAEGAKRWSEEDTWARQTDIVDHKSEVRELNLTAIAVQKNFNSINIARWTTFRVSLLRDAQNLQAEKLFKEALRDYNVEILDGTSIKVVEPGAELQDTSIWNLINGMTGTSQLDSQSWNSCLSFPVRYQLEVCISHGRLSEYTITEKFMRRLAALDEGTAKQMLVYIDSFGDRIWDAMDIFDDLRLKQPARWHKLPANCMETRSATVTATGILFNTPTVEVTNRITRKYEQYSDRFLRVRFEDDAYRGQTKLYAVPNNKMMVVFHRVRRVLRHGIKLGDMHYQFLAWGNSQLRDHGAYFFANTGNVTVSSIREDMGAFGKEKVVAKRAARMGQCFSTTTPIRLRFPLVTEDNLIPDIRNDKYIFTDGVGKISEFAALIIQEQLQIKGSIPSCFQFRLGGCKGVLVVWKELTGIEVKIRRSQFKFDSTAGELEIIRYSQFWQPFLNRQLIIVLSHLGVPDSVFLRKQNETIQALKAALHDDMAALKALRDNVDPNGMTVSMCDLVDAGFRASQEPFVMSLLHLWRAWSLKYLKEKAKIPVSKGAFVLGCADETGVLRGHFDADDVLENPSPAERIKQLPEIFIQITSPQTGKLEIITGLCAVARNPSLHRGDIRVVNAVYKDELKHLRDVVVMPITGDRDLPSMCSGGDLDGDDYIVIWDQELLPKVWNVESFHYEPPPARTVTKDITTEDIIGFFYDYMQNDYLGRIAHAHLAAADFLDDGIDSPACRELVQLHSMAVDYPKTGVPAIMERRLERTRYPHFMEKRGEPYKSHKILGQLYDHVESVKFVPDYKLPFNAHILDAGKVTKEVMRSIKVLKQDYDNAMQRIMAQHNIKTEFEVWSTFVTDHSKASRDYKFHEEIGQLSKSLKEQYYLALVDLAGGSNFEQLTPIAVAAYQFTNGQVQVGLKEVNEGNRYEGPEGMPFISFPWLLQDTLCHIAKNTRGTNPTYDVATFADGEIVKNTGDIEFDEEGRAQVDVLDELDVRLANAGMDARNLPDPYQPDTLVNSNADAAWFDDIELLDDVEKAVDPPIEVAPLEASPEVPSRAEIDIADAPEKENDPNLEHVEIDQPTELPYACKDESSHLRPQDFPLNDQQIPQTETPLAYLKQQSSKQHSRLAQAYGTFGKPDLVRTWLQDIGDGNPIAEAAGLGISVDSAVETHGQLDPENHRTESSKGTLRPPANQRNLGLDTVMTDKKRSHKAKHEANASFTIHEDLLPTGADHTGFAHPSLHSATPSEDSPVTVPAHSHVAQVDTNLLDFEDTPQNKAIKDDADTPAATGDVEILDNATELQQVLEDPINMTAEQMKALGFDDDMEL